MEHVNLAIAAVCGIVAAGTYFFELGGLSLLLLFCSILFVLRERKVDPEPPAHIGEEKN